MAIDTASPRTRRALLTAALGAGVATVATALGRPGPARAGADGDVVLGATNDATLTTIIRNVTGPTQVFKAESMNGIANTGISSASTGVYGVSTSGTGVAGHSSSYAGVYGQSDTSFGVRALSAEYPGIFSESQSPNWPGIVGNASGDSTGILGYSGSVDFPARKAKTGVYGYAAQDSGSRGVIGYSPAGRGVYGVATTGTGLYGEAITGYALRAVGRVKLDKCAGLATIAAGTKSVVVSPGIDLTSTSAVVASLMGSAGGTTTVHRCVVNTTANTFTIYLTANSTANVKVAWHVFG